MSVVCVGCGRDEVYGWEGWRFGDMEGYFRGATHGRTLVVESGDEKRGWGWTSDGEGSCGECAERAADPSRHGLHDVADFQAGPHPFSHTTTPPPAIIMLDWPEKSCSLIFHWDCWGLLLFETWVLRNWKRFASQIRNAEIKHSRTQWIATFSHSCTA